MTERSRLLSIYPVYQHQDKGGYSETKNLNGKDEEKDKEKPIKVVIVPVGTPLSLPKLKDVELVYGETD